MMIKKMKKSLGLWVAALMILAGPSYGEMSAQDSKDMTRVEDYLNGLKTLEADFIQISSNGNYAEGKFYLSRPGKLRFEYTPPVPILVVADGSWFIYYDKELEQVSYLGLDATPAGLIIREHIDFTKDVKVLHLDRSAGVLEIALADAADPNTGSVTLIFSEQPFALRKWLVTDPQGITTSVALSNVRRGLTLDPALFKFSDPNFGKKDFN